MEFKFGDIVVVNYKNAIAYYDQAPGPGTLARRSTDRYDIEHGEYGNIMYITSSSNTSKGYHEGEMARMCKDGSYETAKVVFKEENIVALVPDGLYNLIYYTQKGKPGNYARPCEIKDGQLYKIEGETLELYKKHSAIDFETFTTKDGKFAKVYKKLSISMKSNTLELEESFDTDTIAKAESGKEYAVGMAVYFNDHLSRGPRVGVITDYTNGIYTINYSISYINEIDKSKVDISSIYRALRPGAVISFRSYKGGSRAIVEDDYSLTDLYNHKNIFIDDELYTRLAGRNALDFFGPNEVISEPEAIKKKNKLHLKRTNLELEESLFS